MTTRIGIGVISLGWMGRLHTRAYKQIRERYPEFDLEPRLVAAADPVDAFREEATGALGFERAYADYRGLLADPEVDLVSICAPNFLHHEMALAAVEAGKPFWIEKPMGVSAAQSRDIALAAEEAGLRTAVGFNYRHTPAVMHARSLVAGGRLGRITNVRCWLIADYASSPDGPLTWRYSKEQAGSGVLGDLLSHGFDLAQYVLSDRVASVSAMSGTFVADRPKALRATIGHGAVEVTDERFPVGNEDYAAVLARFDSGVLATFETSRVAHGPRAEYVIEVYGTQGSVRWNYENQMHLDVLVDADNTAHHGYTRVMSDASHGHFGRYQPGPGQLMSFDDMKTIECALFCESVVTGEQLAPSAADAWAAAECDEACVASAADGTWHDVPRVEGPTTYAL
ncbi:Gfo/Idh/MocA family protein [Mobilicoccus caccae]|uniref:Oxidoreductase n=1 Tax=Mobilicoccus caccae TaxID=1859295 RepID=A0ABQ6IUV9_9MICO|nr:Gfo/Idh/MocA family oxidoreductase [Mobilicoccus caccae]GMA41710.1 oxidoreductase [Mobilicoccus caccae]